MEAVTQNFESWQAELEKFQGSAKKELEDIRKCKQEIQRMKNELMEELGDVSRLSRGNYIRDHQRIILSAPEIVIGNVDKDGVLFNAFSNIVVRGNHVSVEGVTLDTGTGGSITTRAAQIRQIAEDPGRDGMEHAVLPISQVVTQAKAIALKTEETEGVFASSPNASMQGIALESETGIVLHATRSVERKKNELGYTVESLKKRAKDLEQQAVEQKGKVDGYLKEIKKLSDTEDLTANVLTVRTNYLDIDELVENFNRVSALLYSAMTGYYHTLALLGETNRQIACLESIKDRLNKRKARFKEESTGTYISIQSESVHALSVDGDGNYRQNPGAGVSVVAKHIGMRSVNVDGSLQKSGSINMQSEFISLDTANPKLEYNADGTVKSGEYPVEGHVSISSRNISLQAVDYTSKNKKMEEKALTKGSSVFIRTEKVDIQATGSDGKATGQVAVNAKEIALKSMDVDKDKGTDKSLSAGSTMLLLAEKLYVGAKDSGTRSQQVQVVSDKTAVFADTTLELQQAKAVVQLSGGNAAVGGGSLDLYGKTTLQGDVTSKGKITCGDIEAKNMKVSSSFKSPCTSEGVAVPGAPATGSLTAKLKEEELKAKEK